MPTYRYTGAYARRYDGLTADDGTTLRLEPGQTVHLADEIDDPWLVPVRGAQATAAANPSRSRQRVGTRPQSARGEGPQIEGVAGTGPFDVTLSAPAPADAASPQE